MQVEIARALVLKGITQGQLGDWAAALETYASVVDRFADSEDRALQVWVAKALVNQGVRLGQLGDSAAALETYASVVERFGASEDRELQEAVARALVNQGMTQGQLGDSAAELETYASVVERFGASEDRELQVRVARATGNAGESLCLVGNAEEALHQVDQLRALAKRPGLESFLIRADWVDAMAHASVGEMSIVEERFRAICSRFDPNDDEALRTFQQDVPTLVALGAAPAALARVLEENEAVYEALRPLAVALRREAGETVRAPAEMLEVADDIQAQIESTRSKIKR